MLRPEDFFDLEDNRFAELFTNVEYVWEVLKNYKKYIKEIIRPNVSLIIREDGLVTKTQVLHDGKVIVSGFKIEELGDVNKGELIVKLDSGETLEGASVVFAGSYITDNNIEIGRGTVIEPGALIKGPTIIGDNTEVRHGAYIRGEVLVGSACVVGHATEVKSSIMLGGSKAGHFAYIGDSILGKVNLGAGTKLANLKIVNNEVVLKVEDRKYETGLRKMGAILGDGVETGCNTVTTPGTLLPKGVLVYPNSTVSGYHNPETIIKLRQKQDQERREK